MANAVIAGGNAVVRRAPKPLLGGVDDRVGFVAGSRLGEPGAPEGNAPIVMAPGLMEEQGAAVLATAVTGARPGGGLGVELIPELWGRPVTSAGTASRHCRADELERQMREAPGRVAVGALAEEKG